MRISFYSKLFDPKAISIKVILIFLVLANLTHAALRSYGNVPILSAGFRADGVGFVRLGTATSASPSGTTLNPANACSEGWIYVSDAKTMSLFLTLVSVGKNAGLVAVNDAAPAAYADGIGTTQCQFSSGLY